MDICADGSIVWASAVPKIYNVLCDQIVLASNATQYMEAQANNSDLTRNAG
jgi:hypothetical protein